MSLVQIIKEVLQRQLHATCPEPSLWGVEEELLVTVPKYLDYARIHLYENRAVVHWKGIQEVSYSDPDLFDRIARVLE